MKLRIILAAAMAALLIGSNFATAQTTVPVDASTVITARVGFAPNNEVNYRFVEVLHQRPDGGIYGAGFVDQGSPTEARDVYAGLGHAIKVPGAAISAVAFISRTAGSDAAHTTSVVPWVLVRSSYKQVRGTANYFVYAPVDSTEGVTQSLEQAKAEWDFGTALGGGGISSQSVNGRWTTTPFISGTLKHPLGNFEVWLQSPADDDRAFQLRYQRAF